MVVPCQKKVVDVDSIPESVVPVEKVSKRKKSTEVAPEKSRKKIRTISLAKKKKKECVTDFHVLSANEPGLYSTRGSRLWNLRLRKKM